PRSSLSGRAATDTSFFSNFLLLDDGTYTKKIPIPFWRGSVPIALYKSRVSQDIDEFNAIYRYIW
ncbi:MAG TPA: hypothetical protein VM901_09270, partial [Bdellovibrionota bacterium]|nr:hypothetical protein [Bdellovibrionota bacterium]